MRKRRCSLALIALAVTGLWLCLVFGVVGSFLALKKAIIFRGDQIKPIDSLVYKIPVAKLLLVFAPEHVQVDEESASPKAIISGLEHRIPLLCRDWMRSSHLSRFFVRRDDLLGDHWVDYFVMVVDRGVWRNRVILPSYLQSSISLNQDRWCFSDVCQLINERWIGHFSVVKFWRPVHYQEGSLRVHQGGYLSAGMTGLQEEDEEPEKRPDNSQDRHSQIPAIKCVTSWVVEISVFLMMCWSAFLKAPEAFADGDDWRGTAYLLLFLICLAACVLLPDTVLGEWGGLPR
jgi:hypothetical protein